jgi:hypothetical protein
MYSRGCSYSDLLPFLLLPDIKTETETEGMKVMERRGPPFWHTGENK